MFTQVPQPLVYAEALLAQFASLSRAADSAALLSEFVRGLAELSGCELTQLYLLDATHTCLGMNAECLDGALQPRQRRACRRITTVNNCCNSPCARTAWCASTT